jgi:hypothetical protein
MTLKHDQNLNTHMQTLPLLRNRSLNDLLLKGLPTKGLFMISKTLILLSCLSMSSLTFAAAKGAGSGGGGDASEERVNEVRSDIVKWIQKGGAKSLNLPADISYEQYVDSMSDILQPKKVVIAFTEEKVLVKRVEKTCKGFYAESPLQANILCNISRFKNTSESQQYSLIHHEYAGLVDIEKNEGAASDYSISNQITAYLENQIVKKLAVRSQLPDTCDEECENDNQKKYLEELYKNASSLTSINDVLEAAKKAKGERVGGPYMLVEKRADNQSYPYNALYIDKQGSFSNVYINNFDLPNVPYENNIGCKNYRYIFAKAQEAMSSVRLQNGDLTYKVKYGKGDMYATNRITIKGNLTGPLGSQYVIAKREICTNPSNPNLEGSWEVSDYLLLEIKDSKFFTESADIFCHKPGN